MQIYIYKNQNKTGKEYGGMEEKLRYLPAKISLIYLEPEDVIATSGDGWLSNDTNPGYDPDGWV